MRILVDSDLNTSLRAAHPLATQIPLDDGLGKKTQVQAASISFTIGTIFVPGMKPDELGGYRNGKVDDHNLAQGQTAVIRTRELIHLSPRQAAIAFPPSSLSLRGLLMTNPGHVDPGYNGPLHCTVINMSREDFHLEAGQQIMRILVFELDGADPAPLAPYGARQGLGGARIGPTPITESLLAKLSQDFVDVEKRAAEAAEKQVTKSQLAALRVPMFTAVIAGALTIFGSYYVNTWTLKDEVGKLRNELAQTKLNLESADKLNKFAGDLASLGHQMSFAKFEERMKKLEDSLNALSPLPQQNRTP
jgi:dCTP deaminase